MPIFIHISGKESPVSALIVHIITFHLLQFGDLA